MDWLTSLVFACKFFYYMFDHKDFDALVSVKGDRSDFILQWLKSKGIDSSKLVIDGKNHVLVNFNKSFYDPKFKIKTVIAHHDRKGNSPGANDNSSAVWCLMNWAVYLSSLNFKHNVRLIFTDGEELGMDPVTGKMEQGSYALAQTFRRLGLVNDDVFVFDCVGRGTVAVLSAPAVNVSNESLFVKKYISLYKRTESLLTKCCPGSWISHEIAYSDNASFIASGIPAVAITLLPSNEATLLLQNKNYVPETWTYFHTEKDSVNSLTLESWPVMSNILCSLAALKTVCTDYP